MKICTGCHGHPFRRTYGIHFRDVTATVFCPVCNIDCISYGEEDPPSDCGFCKGIRNWRSDMTFSRYGLWDGRPQACLNCGGYGATRNDGVAFGQNNETKEQYELVTEFVENHKKEMKKKGCV